MSNPTFIGLINNTALLLALGVMYGFLLHRKETLGWKLLSGLALGLICSGLMMNPWQLAPGVFFDTRSILMSVGGLFLGAVTMIPAMFLSILYRVHAGGAGTLTGVLWILCSGSIGLIWIRIRKRPAYKFSATEFYLFGFAVQIVMLLLMLTMPGNMGISIIQRITVPVLSIFPLATLFLAKMLANQEIQQRNKSELDASARKYRELIDNSQAIILRFDNNGKVTFFNEFAQTFFGYPEDEILGQNLLDTIIPQEDPVRHDVESMIADLHLSPGQQLTHENDNICRDGRRVRILWKNSPVLEDDTIIGFQSIGHDVTEQRRAETALQAAQKQFHQLIDVSPIPLAMLENSRTFTYFNSCFTETFGYTLDDLPTIDDWWEQAYPEQDYRNQVRQRWMTAASDAVEQKSKFSPQEAHITCKDGTVLDVVASFASIGSHEIVVLTDMSKERQLDRLKSEFIATAAHELNTPLSSVMGFSELLFTDDELDRDTQKDYLGIILDKSETLEHIVNDLLALSRAEGGHSVALEKQACDLYALIEKALNSYRKEFYKRTFTLEWLVPAEKVFSIDRIKISQVLENLLSNAVKFSEESTPVKVTALQTDREIQISVSDQGLGMTQEQAAKACERFYRANTSLTAITGLGLGLAITKGIVEAHGGAVDIESNPGLGTTIHVTLSLL